MSFDAIRNDYFPHRATDTCVVRSVEASLFWDLAGELNARVFTPMHELGLATFQPPPKQLAEAWNVHREFFVFYDNDDSPIGWSFCEQREPDTIFMTWTGVLPQYQNNGIYSAFLRHFLEYAQALGYRRVTSNHMVNNRRILVAKLKAGFVASGMRLDERWGAMIFLICHLDDDLAATYTSAFSLETYDS